MYFLEYFSHAGEVLIYNYIKQYLLKQIIISYFNTGYIVWKNNFDISRIKNIWTGCKEKVGIFEKNIKFPFLDLWWEKLPSEKVLTNICYMIPSLYVIT